jgi:predicted lipid-binding transport protein (Tim44 family)
MPDRARPLPPLSKEKPMLGIIAGVLVVLWLLGFFALHVGGGLIHLLLVIAVIVIVIQVVSGRRTI